MKKFLYPLLGIFCTNYYLSAKADQINLAFDIANPIHETVQKALTELKEFDLSGYQVYEPKQYHITLANKPTAELNIQKYEAAKTCLKEHLKNISFKILGLELVGEKGQYIALKVKLDDNIDMNIRKKIAPVFTGSCVHISLIRENLNRKNSVIKNRLNSENSNTTDSMNILFDVLKKKERQFIFENFKELESKKNPPQTIQSPKKVEPKETKPKTSNFKPAQTNRKRKKTKSNEINFKESNFKKRSINFRQYYEN